jgi:hypothetical protein
MKQARRVTDYQGEVEGRVEGGKAEKAAAEKRGRPELAPFRYFPEDESSWLYRALNFTYEEEARCRQLPWNTPFSTFVHFADVRSLQEQEKRNRFYRIWHQWKLGRYGDNQQDLVWTDLLRSNKK